MALLEFKNISFTYTLDNKKILNNINFSIEEGEFVVICGPTGSGKSTLLKLIKNEIRPNGKLDGEILFKEENINKLTLKESVVSIGYVMQNVEAQIVNDKVYDELAFGLANLGFDYDTINLRISEVCNYFGLNHLLNSYTKSLSGGEKQLLNLASILAMKPKILLIDEPTSQLDPVQASNFFQILKKLNQEFSMTIILVDHKIDEIYNAVDKVIFIDKGEVLEISTPKDIGNKINSEKLLLNLPAFIRIGKALGWNDYPLTIKEAKGKINSYKDDIKYLEVEIRAKNKEIIKIKGAYFKYHKLQNDILSNLDLTIHENEVFSIIGSNGSGKTTLLKIMCHLLEPYYGSVYVNGKNIKKYTNKELYYQNIAYLPQNPSEILFKMSVREDLDYDNIQNKDTLDLINRLEISSLLDKHPDDLSGGEIQKVAIAKVLLQEPKVILFDEPTKGLDNYLKDNLVKMINLLKERNITIVIVSHDVDFCVKVSDRVGLLFNGKIIANGTPREIFQNNFFYTTITNKICKDKYPNVLIEDELIKIIKLNGGL